MPGRSRIPFLGGLEEAIGREATAAIEDVLQSLAVKKKPTPAPRKAPAAPLAVKPKAPAAKPAAKPPAAKPMAARPAAKKPAAPSPLAVRPASEFAAPPTLQYGSGPNRDLAADVFAAAGAPGKKLSFSDWRASQANTGAQLFDTSRLHEVPDVPQTQMPRYEPPRGPSARIQDALAQPEVAGAINDIVAKGVAMGGPRWYNTEPLLARMRTLMPDTDAAAQYARLMDLVAATSPGAKVQDNIRTASYYNYLAANGLPIPDKPAKGYGAKTQGLHTQNVRNLQDLGGWDIFRNPKPASFSTNLQGNQRNVTIDTHNFRLPGILARDPRFLETSIKPEKGEAVEMLRPQRWYNEGSLSMDDAVARPVFWTAKPNNNEYAFYEAWQQQQARELGLTPAQYQASMWIGGGDDTGLGSAPEAFLDTLDSRVRYTGDRLNVDHEKVLDRLLRGETPLLATGGAVTLDALASKYNWSSDADAQRI
jgi:hypothetical protein